MKVPKRSPGQNQAHSSRTALQWVHVACSRRHEAPDWRLKITYLHGLPFSTRTHKSLLCSAQASRPTTPGSTPQAENAQSAELVEVMKLVALLPPAVRHRLEEHPHLPQLLEVVMDLGRPPLARFPEGDVKLATTPITHQDLAAAVANCEEFGGDNRAGIDRTLHRISCIRNRSGKIVGLTCRVGRAITGSAALIADLVMEGKSILMLGRPGVGKTTAIREIARLLANECRSRVIIVDTSNEIGGDGDIPHPGVGGARRMQVPQPEEQHRVMIEAVENHMPQTIIIDEIGTAAEAEAARTIAQRGVQLVATAHGNELENVMKNPSLNDLVGGICSVTLGDDEAKRRGVQKSILERQSPPTFDVAVEMTSRECWLVHKDVASAVDALLSGHEAKAEIRERDADGRMWSYPEGETTDYEDESDSEREDAEAALASDTQYVSTLASFTSGGRKGGSSGSTASKRSNVETQPFPAEALAAARGRSSSMVAAAARPDALQLFLYGVDEDSVASVAEVLRMGNSIAIAERIQDADAVLATRTKLKSSGWLKEAAKAAGIPIYSIKAASVENVVRAVRTLMGIDPSPGSMFSPVGEDPDAPNRADPKVATRRTLRAETSIALVKGSKQNTPSTAFRDGAVKTASEKAALEEARSAAEQIVLRLGQPTELLPRDVSLLELQAELVQGMGLEWEIAGSEGAGGRRLRVLPAGYSAVLPEERDARPVGAVKGGRKKEYW